MISAIVNYATHLIASGILLGIFFVIYTKVTPFDELALIHAGKGAAALSLGGALIGFSLTLGSAIVHNATLVEVVMWAVAAMIVQIIVYTIASRMMHGAHRDRGRQRRDGRVHGIRLAGGRHRQRGLPVLIRRVPSAAASFHARIRSFCRRSLHADSAFGA